MKKLGSFARHIILPAHAQEDLDYRLCLRSYTNRWGASETRCQYKQSSEYFVLLRIYQTREHRHYARHGHYFGTGM